MANDLSDCDPHYLYKIENKVNGKLYIGVTKNLEHRKNCHLRYPNYKDEIRLVNLAVEKYGEESFDFSVLCVGDREYIYNLEVKAILAFNSHTTTGHGYNLCVGGKGGKGGKRGPVNKRVDDKFVYVSGWWFPNKRTSLKTLGWKTGLYNSRERKGMLGIVQLQELKRSDDRFVFVSGFWFPNRRLAMKSLNWGVSKYNHRKRNNQLGDLTLTKNSKEVNQNGK